MSRAQALRNIPLDGRLWACAVCRKPFATEQARADHAKAKGHAQDGSQPVEPMTPAHEAPVCQYCEDEAELLDDSSILYNGKNYGPVWICWPCEAWVGCHPGTTTPKGILADKELRRAKMAAHAAFDRLWRAKMRRDRCKQRVARGAAYAWLAQQLGIDPLYCHIGLFHVERCQRVVELCAPFHAENRARAQ